MIETHTRKEKSHCCSKEGTTESERERDREELIRTKNMIWYEYICHVYLSLTSSRCELLTSVGYQNWVVYTKSVLRTFTFFYYTFYVERLLSAFSLVIDFGRQIVFCVHYRVCYSSSVDGNCFRSRIGVANFIPGEQWTAYCFNRFNECSLVCLCKCI